MNALTKFRVLFFLNVNKKKNIYIFFLLGNKAQQKDVASHRANKACCSLTLIRLRSLTRPESVGLVR